MDRRTLLIGAAACAASGTVSAAPSVVPVLTADVRPLSISEGRRRGIVLDIVEKALVAGGLRPEFRFMPFADAIERTRAEEGTLMAPIARSPQREDFFDWIAKIIDIPQVIGVLRRTAPATVEEAKSLRAIGVVRAGIQEAFLRLAGISNLTVFSTGLEVGEALVRGEVEGWYASAPEIAWFFANNASTARLSLGPALQIAPVWLVGNKAGAENDARIRAELERLEADGTVTSIYHGYVPS